MPFSPLGGNSNIDFANSLELLNALQRNPQISRLSGTGTQSTTGSVIYGIALDVGTVTILDLSTNVQWGSAAPGIVFPFGMSIPAYIGNPAIGGSITVTPSNLSTVHYALLYK